MIEKVKKIKQKRNESKREHYKITEKPISSKQKQYKSKQKRHSIKHNRDKNKHKLVSIMDFEFQILEADLMHGAKVLQIPEGAAKAMTKKVVENTKKWLDASGKATLKELQEEIVAELEKYHADLSYVYKNRDKII